jgi:hypothetical protein
MKKIQIAKICENCSNEFIPTRSDAKYCRPVCRTEANSLRRINEVAEAEKAKKQAEIDQAKRDDKDARALKRATKKAVNAAAESLAAEELQIQAEINAWELSERHRGINSIVGMLRVNAEVRETKRLEEEEFQKIVDRLKLAYEMNKAKERAEQIANGLAEIFKNLSTPNKETENPSKKQDDIIQPHQPQKPGDSHFQEDPNSINAELKSNDLPSLNAPNDLVSPEEQASTPHYENIKPAPPNNGPGNVNIAGNIIDLINSFFK